MVTKRITFDFETRSACDLKKAGAYKYSLDPTTQPTCMAYKFRNRNVQVLNFKAINSKWESLPSFFRGQWIGAINGNFLFTAHNAFFERCIYTNIMVKRYGWPPIPLRQFRCTAAKAAACALPRSLEAVGDILNLTTQKDRYGYIAMMATCKPTKQWNAWNKLQTEYKAKKRISVKRQLKAIEERNQEPPKFLEYDANPDIWEALYKYCKIDVRTEELLDERLPDLIPSEQEIWFLNQFLNWRGLRIDMPIVKKIVGIMESQSKTKLKELDTLTFGLVTKAGARKSILEFLALEGIILPDIRAKTVEDALKNDAISGDMKKLLEIRKALSKTSTRKYQAFIDRGGIDDRVRDILLYHGASTGRDSGTGAQFHNLPRPLISQIAIEEVIELLQFINDEALEWIEFFYGNLSLVFSSLIRSMLIPSEGHELYVADFSKIEVAVLWWLSDNEKGLEILRSGKDPYKYQAAANTGKTYDEIADDGDERQLGKAQILGAGFRMGWKKFQKAAFDQYRLKLTNKESLKAVKNYREANAPVVKLWNDYEKACVEAVETRKVIKAGKCSFHVANGFLWATLPSGRRLAYFRPSITWRTITYTALEVDEEGNEIEVERVSEPKKTVQFYGVDKSKKSMAVEFHHGGIITENIVQAVARDLMMPAMLRLHKAGYTPLLMVHDEGICENKIGTGSIKEFVKILCETPLWADEKLPLDAKGWVGMRYRK